MNSFSSLCRVTDWLRQSHNQTLLKTISVLPSYVRVGLDMICNACRSVETMTGLPLIEVIWGWCHTLSWLWNIDDDDDDDALSLWRVEMFDVVLNDIVAWDEFRAFHISCCSLIIIVLTQHIVAMDTPYPLLLGSDFAIMGLKVPSQLMQTAVCRLYAKSSRL